MILAIQHLCARLFALDFRGVVAEESFLVRRSRTRDLEIALAGGCFVAVGRMRMGIRR